MATPPTVRNIFDFDPPPPLENGDIDITDTLRKALDAVPDARAIPLDQPIQDNVPVPGLAVEPQLAVEHGTTILFPSLQGEAAYVLVDTMDIPPPRKGQPARDINVRLAASSPYGARIELRTGPHPNSPLERGPRPALRSLGGRRAHIFENLIFRGGGVTIGGENEVTGGMTEFLACVFTEIINNPEEKAQCDEHRRPVRQEAELKWAISTAGAVVGVKISACQFVQTDAGVGVLHNGCDNWIIGDNSTFVRMNGVGVEIRSSGVTVQNARFEDKLPCSGSLPYIRIRGFGEFDGGLSEITGCRFGGEVGKERFENPDTKKKEERLLDGPPRHAIEVGPNITAKHPTDPVTGLLITRNRFFGRTKPAGKLFENEEGGPTAQSAVHAISLQAPARHTIVTGNHFHRYFAALVEETEVNLVKVGGKLKSHSNLFMGNAVERQVIRPGTENRPFQGIFSMGGQPWEQFANGEGSGAGQ